MPINILAKKYLTPVSAVFLGSIFLSLIARFNSTLNRDGMLYVKTAHAFLEGGFETAKAIFSWPFLSILMAITSSLTGLDLETSGHLLNAIFMAGSFALMIDIVRRSQPEVAWWTCLAVLAIPGLNEYRSELIREYGCWFFTVLSFWQALRWSDNPKWSGALLIMLSIVCGALFRPEALALYPAFLVWQLVQAPREKRMKRLIMLGAIPATAASLLLYLYFNGHLSEGNRLAGEIGRLNLTRFNLKAEGLASLLIGYAHGNARSILFFGSLAIIPLNLFSKFGIFIIPLAMALPLSRAAISGFSLLCWGIFFQIIVLAVFVIDLQFLAGRYVGLVLLLSCPFIGIGLQSLSKRYPKLRVSFVAISLAIMLSNAISASPAKTQFVEAGQWLAKNAKESSNIYIESERTAYYAGWYKIHISGRNELDALIPNKEQNNYDFLVFEVDSDGPPIDDLLKKKGVHEIKRFEHTNKSAVIIASKNIMQANAY